MYGGDDAGKVKGLIWVARIKTVTDRNLRV